MKTILAAFAFTAFAVPALAQVAAPADTRAITDCVKKAESAGGLGGQCIGLVADPCIKKSDKTSDKAKLCATRELAVWIALADAASKKVRAGGFKEISAAVAESDKGWVQLRDQLCPVFDKVDPGMAPGGVAYCRMQTTAHRALLLRKLGEAVSEH